MFCRFIYHHCTTHFITLIALYFLILVGDPISHHAVPNEESFMDMRLYHVDIFIARNARSIAQKWFRFSSDAQNAFSFCSCTGSSMLKFLFYISGFLIFLSNVNSFLGSWLSLHCAGIYEKFATAFSKAVTSLQVGDGFCEGVTQVVIHSFLFLVSNKIPLLVFLFVHTNAEVSA